MKSTIEQIIEKNVFEIHEFASNNNELNESNFYQSKMVIIAFNLMDACKNEKQEIKMVTSLGDIILIENNGSIIKINNKTALEYSMELFSPNVG